MNIHSSAEQKLSVSKEFTELVNSSFRLKKEGHDLIQDFPYSGDVISSSHPHIDFRDIYTATEINFGIELEFSAGYGYQKSSSIDPFNPYTLSEEDSTNSLSLALFEEEMTSVPFQEGYHARKGEVSRSHHRGWKFEFDGSVTGGEVISPVMSDTAQTWDRVEKALKLIKGAGGMVDENSSAGSHIHVDTSVIQDDVEKFHRLFRIFTHFEDIIFALAANPHHGGKHRGHVYCSPNSSSFKNNSYVDLSEIVRSQGSHKLALSTACVTSFGVGHVEFRLWDASLDINVIKTQVMLSTAMVAAAANPDVDALLDRQDPKYFGHYLLGENKRNILQDAETFIHVLNLDSMQSQQVVNLLVMNASDIMLPS